MMKLLNKALTFVLIQLLHCNNYAFAKYVSGHLITHENWAFLDRFCFLSLEGSFEYQIEFEYDPENMGNVSLLMYPDLNWSSAYKNPKANTCQKKRNILSLAENQIVPLAVGFYGSGCEAVNHPKIDENGNTTYSTTLLCKNFRKFRSARERWWFISIASCNSKKGLDIKYRFYMKNGDKGDYWYEHFSADEFYILPILTSFCFTYLFLLFCALIFAVELKCRQLLHTTYKLYLLSLLLQTAGIMNLCLAYGNFANNGVGLPGLKLTGRILEGGSEFVFVLLLLLLAKGYTVTRGRLRPASAVKLTVFNCSYILLFSLLFIFEQYTFDPGLVLYIYESEAGYGILILRLIGYLMFVYGIFFTLKHYPEKSSFYFPFFGIYSLWFISGPIVILISNYVIDKWVREKVAISIQHSIAFVGHVVFLGLTRPSAANKSFPYHVRTTQVGMMDDKLDRVGGNTGQSQDNFDAHSYAPSAPAYDIFTVTGVMQRSPGVYGTNGPNFDMFSATGSTGGGGVQPGGSVFPAMFPAPPPKYEDAFPHEKPGQIQELLREQEEEDEEGDSADAGESRDHNGNNDIDDHDDDDASSASYRPSTNNNNNINCNNNNTRGRSAFSPPHQTLPLHSIVGNNTRESKYMCD